MSKEIKKVAIITKKHNESYKKFVKNLISYLKKKKVQILFDKNCAKLLHNQPSDPKSKILKNVDLVIILGGDGTVLKTARKLARKKVLVLSINMGNLGFLTECKPDKAFDCLDKIFAKQFTVDKRALLRVTVYRHSKKIETYLTLNEAVISQMGFARLITMDLAINGRKVVNVKGDGLIVSTPTGSTGHSLSAGGPIIHPSIEGLTITPICPISIAMRPIIIPDNRQLTATISTQRRQEEATLGLTLDGQEMSPLKFGDKIRFRRSSRNLYLIRTGDRYYKSLRQKLNWGISNH